jgi:hypothetical protein
LTGPAGRAPALHVDPAVSLPVQVKRDNRRSGRCARGGQARCGHGSAYSSPGR